MKLKALAAALALAGFSASFALADDGGTDPTTTGTTTTATTTTADKERDCRRIELRGTLASVSASSFVVDVVRARKAYALTDVAVTLTVGPRTRVRFDGFGRLAPQAGDRVDVLAAKCASTGEALVARWVVVSTAKPAAERPEAVKAPERSQRHEKAGRPGMPQKGDRR